MKIIEGFAGAITGNEDNKRWDVLINTKYGKIITMTFDDRDVAWEVYCKDIKIQIMDERDERTA
jgi:hypothetical protein